MFSFGIAELDAARRWGGERSPDEFAAFIARVTAKWRMVAGATGSRK
jgi:hypothetical protein